MVNKVQRIGRLGQDPEFRTTRDGAELARFSLATDRHWSDSAGVKQTRTDWHQAVAWGRLAEISRDYLAKGRLVYGRAVASRRPTGGATRAGVLAPGGASGQRPSELRRRDGCRRSGDVSATPGWRRSPPRRRCSHPGTG